MPAQSPHVVMSKVSICFWMKVRVSHVAPSHSATGVPQVYGRGFPDCTSLGICDRCHRQIDTLRIAINQLVLHDEHVGIEM